MKLGDKLTLHGLDDIYATRVIKLGKKGKRSFSGLIVSIADKHFTLDNGKYRESFLFVDHRRG